MSTLQQDFDRIALSTEASADGTTHNDHYHNYLLRHLPANCQEILEIGCGTGTFSRRLAQHLLGVRRLDGALTQDRSGSSWHYRDLNAGTAGKRGPHRGSPDGVLVPPADVRILALDLSPEMIRLARERSTQFQNIEFELADILQRDLPSENFDCIATIATLHHLPYKEMLAKMKAALKPGGVILILDLFEPAGLMDSLSNLLAIPVSVGLRLLHHRRLLPRKQERDAWEAHAHHDLYPTMSEVRDLCPRVLPGAKIKQHLLWRYSIVWEKPTRPNANCQFAS